MTFRATLALLGCALAAAHAAPATYQRAEAFKSPPKNWRYFNPDQGFGYFPTSDSTGLAGGFFFPKTYTAYYADTYLKGAFHRSNPITATGRIRLDELSFDPNYTNTVYVAHFRSGTTNAHFVNIVGMSLTGSNHGTIYCRPIVQFSNGSAYLGGTITLPVDSRTVDWSYVWSPGVGMGELTVTIDDITSTLSLPGSSSDLDYALDAFGLYQPAFIQPNSNSYLLFFIHKLGYTAFVGGPPSLHVKGPKNLTTSTSTVNLAGTTHIGIGNRVTAVRYRVVQNEKVGRYKAATGIDNWTASVHVPSGSSTVEVTAVADNGLKKTVRRDVTSTP